MLKCVWGSKFNPEPLSKPKLCVIFCYSESARLCASDPPDQADDESEEQDQGAADVRVIEVQVKHVPSPEGPDYPAETHEAIA